jgi:hypothetical protein
MSRTFQVKFSGDRDFEGRYTGTTPKAAASKAFTKHIQARGKSPATFVIREATRGSEHKEYRYRAERVKLEETVSYTLPNGQTIVRKYKNVVKAQK